MEDYPAVLADPEKDDPVKLEQLSDEVAEAPASERPDGHDVNFFEASRGGRAGRQTGRQARNHEP